MIVFSTRPSRTLTFTTEGLAAVAIPELSSAIALIFASFLLRVDITLDCWCSEVWHWSDSVNLVPKLAV